MTELVFILDRSGSMCGLEEDTIGGFNSMIKKQMREEGKVVVSTVLFDSRSEVLHDRVPLEEIRLMTRNQYFPGGSTALLDAVGGAIHHIGNVHKYARREDVPEKTMFVIITDGMENSSHMYSYKMVRDMIRRQKKNYDWEFLFLGANIDAEAEGERFGIDRMRSVSYNCDEVGTRLNYEVVSDAICCFRQGKQLGNSWKDRIDEDFEMRGNK